MKKKFYVLWIYEANSSELVEVETTTPELAAEFVTAFFSDDFKAKGSVYVFDSLPILMKNAEIQKTGRSL